MTELATTAAPQLSVEILPRKSTAIMAIVILALGFYLIYPVFLILIQSFNTAPEILIGTPKWGLDNWRAAFTEPRLLQALTNTIMIWALVMLVSFPTATLIAWTLARTNIPFSHSLEFMFWISYMMPGISIAVAWIMLLDPELGFINIGLQKLFPSIKEGPFNIFSVPGIVWAHLMANGVALKVMLLTPAFRNMDATMEEAARVSGASDLRTMLRVTFPLMASPLALVFALQLLRIFQSFEIEQLLGVPFSFFVYSTMIFDMVRREPPLYGQATALASITLLVVALIIPMQRWILQRRHYTTITGSFKPGLIDLGKWKWPVFGVAGALIVVLTLLPAVILVLGSFMTRSGFFNINPVFTLEHWKLALTDHAFVDALKMTLILATTAALLGPLVFSILAYIMVHTQWAGRAVLDYIIWGSAAIPGILSGLGLLWLFLGDFPPGSGFRPLAFMYGSIYALLLVVIIQGKTTGTNIFKGMFVQVGKDMEEQARVSGAGWLRTYFRVWIPLLMPTWILIATHTFVIAANTTSSIILLADRSTRTLSILALEFASPEIAMLEEASIISIFLIVLTVGIASVARAFGLRLGVQHEHRLSGSVPDGSAEISGGARPKDR
ncbi:MAG TPA: ABC transporter permease subunit [Verrucomicrobiae bacterium]|nr:ABC transporter permease subunit [Verrucomicrobiae bacterium]